MPTVNPLFILLTGFALGLPSVIFFKNLSLKKKVLFSKGIPLIGGISMGGAFILTCLLSFIFCNLLSQQVAGILLASAIMLFFGITNSRA